MEFLPIALAALALVVALIAWRTAGVARRAAEEAKGEALRRAGSALEEMQGRLDVTHKLLARVASGARLDPEQVLEGRLWREVGVREAERLVAEGAVRLLDVRTPLETAAGIIPGALLVPIDELESRVRELPKAGKGWLVYCAGGSRSAAACEFLAQQGYDELLNLEGGYQSWGGPRAKP
jgi:rhodanese-related sulfurtransferase